MSYVEMLAFQQHMEKIMWFSIFLLTEGFYKSAPLHILGYILFSHTVTPVSGRHVLHTTFILVFPTCNISVL